MTARAGAPPAATSAARTVAFGVLLPAIAGAACVLGFAPFYAWPVPILGLAVLFFAWTRSGSRLQAAISGFAFGLGYFLAGVSWVFVSLHYFGQMPAVLAAIATFLFCAYHALFPAAAGWLTIRLARENRARRLVVAAAAMVATEWLRGWLFTGFPWLNLGTSQAPNGPLAGYAPYLGAYGASLAVAAAAALFAALAASREARHRAMLAAGLAALFIVGVAASLVEWTKPASQPITIGLLQGNVPQEMKWREEVRTRTLLEYRRMIFETQARVVIIPETALPAFLDQLPGPYVESLRAHAREAGKEILLGTVEREFRGGDDYRYYNSVVRLTGEPPQTYRKRHLVPFGEFIPPGFHWILDILRIPLSDFSRGAAGQPPLVAAGVPFAVAICYEDLFGEEMIDALPRAQVLVNVSNDAWFGESWAAEQHLQASQMRALETGRWMVRSTNTGVTAAIDERGRVAARLPNFTAGAVVHAVTPRSGSTPYVWWGNVPALLIVAALAVFGRARRL